MKNENKEEILGDSKKPLKKALFFPAEYRKTIDNLSKINLKIINAENNIKIARLEKYPDTEGNLICLEEKDKYCLDARNGLEKMKEYPLIAAYDESINRFSALEGTAYLTSHTVVFLYNDEYIPISLITIYFFTKAKIFERENQIADGIIITDDISYASKEIYVRDKVNFLKENIPPNTLLFIDGPLIGGDWYVKMINAILNYFNFKNIIPIFIVKNSLSNIIISNHLDLIDKYNSDMHWAYYNLNRGERTSFFEYVDRKNPRNARVFCYIKAFDASPLRVELHPSTFDKCGEKINDILNIIYYFLLVQGDSSNPQIRPIAIAEEYARETLHLFDLEHIIKKANLIPTINQERFGWST